jgi:putative Holliday junction resolvase
VSDPAPVKRLLGIDLGQARVGLAISDELAMLAHPLETFSAESSRKLLEHIAALVRERLIECVVIGLPRNMDGSAGPAAEQALDFAQKLRAQISCSVVTWDERLTTVAANRALQEAGRKTRSTREYVDQVAAQLILQGYLDHLQLQREAQE